MDNTIFTLLTGTTVAGRRRRADGRFDDYTHTFAHNIKPICA